jgi:hypothetical protein
MTTRVIAGIVALACVSVCGLVSTIVTWQMLDEVNEKLPKEEQFAALWWYASKRLRLHREYKRLYPNGRLLLKLHVLGALMIVCLFVFAWGFGFFARWTQLAR